MVRGDREKWLVRKTKVLPVAAQGFVEFTASRLS
jgi:hypothetical protein